ncbi:uncharacterized protein LOC129877174 [Solanum dulcamara]|uniref:uncharacterized protein LOC129877174 n=1 Tax=Solanum dulcamara TaxID=45834 RepID=UPI00248609AD|nr:uncharacterized protein LOC129877174 [Solanum dulcamara]
MLWCLAKPNNKIHETMYQCLPTFVSWEIWKTRCKARFEGSKVSTYGVVEQVLDIVNQIKQIMENDNFRITHYFREANEVADLLANVGVMVKHDTFFIEVFSLPKQVKIALKNDQDGRPNLRIRIKKRTFQFLTCIYALLFLVVFTPFRNIFSQI